MDNKFNHNCRNGRPVQDIELYIDKVSNLEDKFDLFIQIKSCKKALDVATKLKDPRRLEEVFNYYYLLVLSYLNILYCQYVLLFFSYFLFDCFNFLKCFNTK